jgi:acetoin utilization deacetylase AcuC-like enzyme
METLAAWGIGRLLEVCLSLWSIAYELYGERAGRVPGGGVRLQIQVYGCWGWWGNQLKVVYSKHYGIDIAPHPWHTSKYALVLDRLKALGVLVDADVIEAEMADDEDVLRVHSMDFWRKLCDVDFSAEERELLELPINQAVVDFFWTTAGGSIQASEQALRDGICVHLGGGFHHAYRDYGSGFCLINDIAVSVRSLQERGVIQNAAVIDCDVHQGDGTAAIFKDDPCVLTFSMHQRRGFPYLKQQSTIDIELDDETGDDEYLSALSLALEKIFDGSRAFDLIHYQAGVDPSAKDTLGNLRLSEAGLMDRDRRVFAAAKAAHVPVVVTLGGGYPVDVEDVVRFHANTVLAALGR